MSAMISGAQVRLPMWKMALLVIAMLAIIKIADARVFKGSIKTKNDWQYFAKFCFFGNQQGLTGKVSWNIPSPANPNRKMLMYWDQYNKNAQGSWVNVYKNKKLTCAQKSNPNDTAAGGIVNLYTDPVGTKTPKNSYKHFWWFVVADCGASSQNIPSYSIHITQYNGSELSCDEYGTSPLLPQFWLPKNFEPQKFVFARLSVASPTRLLFHLPNPSSLHLTLLRF